MKNYKETERHNFEKPSNGMQYQAEEVQKCIKEGKLESDIMSWDTSLALHEIMDKVRSEVGVSYIWD